MDRVVISAGFPRSGTSFLLNCLVNAFPNEKVLRLSWEPITLRDINCIVPFRCPSETIPSASIFFKESNIESVIKWHNRFMSEIIKNIDHLILIDFYSLIKDPKKEIKKISKVYNIKFEDFDHSNFFKNESKKEYNKISKDDHRIKESMEMYNYIYNLCKSQEKLIQ